MSEKKNAEKTVRFGMVMDELDSAALNFLVQRERMSAAHVVRRLVWRSALESGWIPNTEDSDCEQSRDKP